MTNKYEKLIEKALEMLKEDDDLFCEMVDKLDSWNGYADGFRCYGMDELDDLFCDCKLSEFLEKIVPDSFNLSDPWIYFSIYGLESTDNKVLLYRDNADEGEVLDAIIEDANHLYFSDKDFEDLIDEIVNYPVSDDDIDEDEEDAISA